MKMKRILWLLSNFAILLSACSAGESYAELEGKVWALTEMNGQSPVADHAPTILFDDGQVSGNASCNHYGSSYKTEGETLLFDDLYSTEIACMEPAGLMEQESLYLQLLRDASRFEMKDDLLTIFTNSGEKLVFRSVEGNTAEDSTISIEGNQAENESVSEESVQTSNLPDGYKEYRDEISGISIKIPENWIVTGVVDGQYAIFQSYPEDKYVGGEILEPGDTKCDLNIQPQGTQVASLVEQWEVSEMTEIVSREEIKLRSGLPAERFVIDNIGRSTVFAADIDQRAVLLTCFGDFSVVDVIASTISADE